MLHRPRTAALLVVIGLLTAALAGCAGDAWAQPRTPATPEGSPGAGFVPSATPSPEATIHPPSGSWEGISPPAGYRVVLLTAGDDTPTQTIVSAVRAWADDERADLRTVVADGDPVDEAVAAIAMKPDLIVIAGNDLVDPMAIISANHLDQQFLVVGAELAEPTQNVTAADWTGASFRGEGLGASSTYDESSFTPDRCEAALRAGVAAVLSGLTGIVLWID